MSEKSTALTLLSLALISAGIIFYFTPGAGSIYPPCPTKYLTTYSCPGCGSLRSVHNLLHGNVEKAFYFNPLTVIALPFLAVWSVLYLLQLFFKMKLPPVKIKPFVIWLLISAIIIFTVLRNLPFYSFILFRS
jgi:hypothetical protein